MQTFDFAKETEERFESCKERFKSFKKTNKLSVNKKEPIICDGCQKPIIKNEQYLLRIVHCSCGKNTEKIPFCYCNNCAKKYLTEEEYSNLYNKDDSANFGQEVISIFSLINGYQLSYSLSNSEISEELRDFRNSFENALIEFLNKRSAKAKEFLNFCLDNKQKIFDKDFSFLLRNKENKQ